MEKTKGPISSFVSGVALGSIVGLGAGYVIFSSGPNNGRQREEKKGRHKDKKREENCSGSKHAKPGESRSRKQSE